MADRVSARERRRRELFLHLVHRCAGLGEVGLQVLFAGDRPALHPRPRGDRLPHGLAMRAPLGEDEDLVPGHAGLHVPRSQLPALRGRSVALGHELHGVRVLEDDAVRVGKVGDVAQNPRAARACGPSRPGLGLGLCPGLRSSLRGGRRDGLRGGLRWWSGDTGRGRSALPSSLGGGRRPPPPSPPAPVPDEMPRRASRMSRFGGDSILESVGDIAHLGVQA